MKKLIINALVGVFLFGGSLVGGLAATGRLNHDGVANIPLLSSFFPEPAAEEGAAGDAGADAAHDAAAAQGGAADAHAAPMGEVADATHSGTSGVDDAALEGGQEPQGPRRTKTGKSVENPEPPPGEGGGHGEAPAEGEHGGGHGEEAAGADGKEHKPKAGHGNEHGGEHGKEKPGADAHSAERDFSAREIALAQERTNRYSPGGYFTFPGMPAGMTPEQLNEAWQRVQAVMAELEQRKVALDLREKGLAEREDDIGRRQLEIARLREEVENSHRALDQRIAKFQEQVKLVRNDEVAGLRRNAQTLESFEAAKAAELVTEQWGTEEGQTELLKTFEFMNKDKVNQIINELANPLIQDVLKKRLLVSKEATPSGEARK